MYQSEYLEAVEFRGPRGIPARIRLMPGAWRRHREELEQLVLRHRGLWPDFVKDSIDYDSSRYREGTWTDEWGCEWTNMTDGLAGLVVGHPLADWKDFEGYRAPEPDDTLPHGFMLLRLFDLRGIENLMMDFADEPPELPRLIDMVLEYNLAAVNKMLAQKPRMIALGEDLGMQDRLLVSPAHWARHIRPAYEKIGQTIRRAGAHFYLHSDGRILEIADDLIKCGVNVINPQIRANTLKGIEESFKGRICIDLDLDRQLFPFCSPTDVDEHIEEAVKCLGSRDGGLMLTAEIEPDVPLENIEAICVALEKYADYKFG